MRRSFAIGLGIAGVFVMLSCMAFAGEVMTILDENVDDVLSFLTNGEGTASKTTSDVNSGSEALQVGSTGSDGQKFNPNVPDWAWEIVESPSADNQFRYITFAWRKAGGDGIQLQLHGAPDTWGHRYHGGANVRDWNPSIQVNTAVPSNWESHTRDLFDDWGEFTLTGIAFTAWDGDSGLWDDVFLHQEEADALSTSVEPQAKVTTTWAALKTDR